MSEPHEQLDRAMTARSHELRKRWVQIAQEAEVTTSALGAIRRGEYRPSPHTARGIERALQWQAGSIESIYRGGEPTPLEVVEPEVDDEGPTRAQLEERVALLERLVIGSMTPEERERHGIDPGDLDKRRLG